jgi:hypothetical protein
MKVYAIHKVYLCCFLITNPVQIWVGPNQPSIPSIASAAAIYGSQANGGVIIIKTKGRKQEN